MEKWSRYNYEQKKAKDKIRYDLDSGDIRGYYRQGGALQLYSHHYNSSE